MVSLLDPRTIRAMRIAIAVLLVVPVFASRLRADTVVLADGSRSEGSVVSVDAQSVLLRVGDETVRIPRAEVASIYFEHPAPPLKVEIRNVQSDDSIDILLDDELLLSQARDKGEWIDVTSKLKEGSNALRLRIHNDRSGWAYHVNVRINGVVSKLSCGRPYDLNSPCRCCGKQGTEIGVIDDLPIVWIHVDRGLGRAEILP